MELRSKRWPMAALALAMLFAGDASAAGGDCASSNPCYEFIPYYNNDPFTFCTLGYPAHCWAPISPQLGTYTVTIPKCFNPVSAQLYARVCPKAFQPAGDGAARRSDPANADQ